MGLLIGQNCLKRLRGVGYDGWKLPRTQPLAAQGSHFPPAAKVTLLFDYFRHTPLSDFYDYFHEPEMNINDCC